MKNSTLYIILFLNLFSIVDAPGQSFYRYYWNRNCVWSKFVPYFTPIEELKNLLGEYCSPLTFYSGKTVETPEKRTTRRAEIWDYWMKMKGEWPQILDQQEFEITCEEKMDGFTRNGVRFYWASNEQTDGNLHIPEKNDKKPAVITLFHEPQTAAGIGEKLFMDFAYQLAKKGSVTLSIGTTETTKNKTYSLYYPSREEASVQPLSMLEYAAANALEMLTKIEDVDPGRIGIVEHSYGVKWAMFASCLYDKFAAAAWIDPGIVFDETKGSGVYHWEPWYLGYYQPHWSDMWNTNGTTAKSLYPLLRHEGFDLHELHALMASRPFLVSGSSSDLIERWVPLNLTISVNKLLG